MKPRKIFFVLGKYYLSLQYNKERVCARELAGMRGEYKIGVNMSEWKEVRLGDVCEILDSKRVPLSAIQRKQRQGPYPYYGAQNIIDHVDDYLLDGEYLLVAEDGANLVTRTQNIANLVSGKFWVNNHAHILGYNGKCPLNLLGFILNKSNISPYVTGCAQPKLNQDNLRRISINLPKKVDEIASILSSFDDKIAINRKICANLEAQAQALFKHWFIDFAPFKDGKFVDSELGMIPEGWKVGTLGDYCKVRSGYAFKSSWWTDMGCKIIKIKNISEYGQLDLSDCSYVTPENCAKASEFKAQAGDLIIAMTGATIGKFNIIPKLDVTCYINQRVGKFFLGERPLERLPFVYSLLKSSRTINQIINRGIGSAQPNISSSDIESIKIAYNEKVINSFNTNLKESFEMFIYKQTENLRLSSLRDTLLPKLMSGEIKV